MVGVCKESSCNFPSYIERSHIDMQSLYIVSAGTIEHAGQYYMYNIVKH